METEISVEAAITEAYKCGSALVELDKDYSEEEPLVVTEEKIRYARTIAKDAKL